MIVNHPNPPPNAADAHEEQLRCPDEVDGDL
jgi:hypothetical protein